VPGGRQPAESYDLSAITPGQLRLIDKAVTDSAGTVRFYAPKNPAHVSHSVVNYQHDYSTDTPYIEVESVTIATILEAVDARRLRIVKFDIEGAEIAVLPQLLAHAACPPQVCVEFDELMAPSARARAAFQVSHERLLAAGYVAAHFDGVANLLYVHRSLY
jgi:FkbM family methyltransferase